MNNKQKIVSALKKEIIMCKKRIENTEYSKQTVHFIAGLERAIVIIESLAK